MEKGEAGTACKRRKKRGEDSIALGRAKLKEGYDEKGLTGKAGWLRLGPTKDF